MEWRNTLATPAEIRNTDIGKLITRVTLGFILLFHGIFKFTHGVDWLTQMLAQRGLPPFFGYGVYIGEIVAPILVILGLLTRPAALVIAFNMLMAISLVLSDKIFTVNERGGGWSIELEAFILLTALAVFFLGPGRYSFNKGRKFWL